MAAIDAWWTAEGPTVVQTVTSGHRMASLFASQYLSRHGRAEGVLVTPFRAQPNAEQIAESLRVTGPVSFKTHMSIAGDVAESLTTMTATLEGSAERLTYAGSRDSILETTRQSPAVGGGR